jgi:hypothetical protein
MQKFLDSKGNEIKEFSLLKIFHFKGVNRRGNGRKIYYMYKWVKVLNGEFVATHLEDDSGDYFHLRTIADHAGVCATAEIVQ